MRISSYTFFSILSLGTAVVPAACSPSQNGTDWNASSTGTVTTSSSSSSSSRSTNSSTSAQSSSTQGPGSSSSSVSSASAGWNQPTPANSTGQFPFPQNRTVSNCTYPTTAVSTLNSQLQAAWMRWKTQLVTTTGAPVGSRVEDPQTNDRTVSEGIGYGMLISVYMADKTTFDALWSYAQHFFDNGLMNWEITSSGTVEGQGSATDADQDMGWALLMATKQWPSGGYESAATTLIGNISSQEFVGNFPNVGNQSMNVQYYDYFSPAYYPGFEAAVSGKFTNAVSTGYSLIGSVANSTTHLTPDDQGSSTFGYDACRSPWRIGVDYCMHDSSQAQAFLAPMVTLFVNTGASGLELPLNLDGTKQSGASVTGAITGPAGVAAMSSSSNQAFVTAAYQATFTQANTTDSGMLNYFGSSLGVLAMLEMSGNFFDYTNPPQ